MFGVFVVRPSLPRSVPVFWLSLPLLLLLLLLLLVLLLFVLLLLVLLLLVLLLLFVLVFAAFTVMRAPFE